MKRRMLAVLLLTFCLLCAPGLAGAESLWADNGGLYGDQKARQVGDVLTIIISESSSAARTGSASNSKEAEYNISAGTGLATFLNAQLGGGSDSFSAKGSVTNTNKVTAKITVQVTEVKPNGNLIVSGTQTIKQNKEEQKITLTGEVRPRDVTKSNTVLSSYVANARIQVDGKGPIANKQKQGILTQIWNIIF